MRSSKPAALHDLGLRLAFSAAFAASCASGCSGWIGGASSSSSGSGGGGTGGASSSSSGSGGGGGTGGASSSSSGGGGGGTGGASSSSSGSGGGGTGGASSSSSGSGGGGGTGGASGSTSSSSSSSSSGSAYPLPPAGGPTSSWSDCSVGLDPTKNGGDLLWAMAITISGEPGSVPGACGDPFFSHGQKLALGPTGDIAVGEECDYFAQETEAHYDRLNGSGVLLDARSHIPNGSGVSNHYGWTYLAIDPDNDLFAAAEGNESCPDGPFGYCPTSASEEVSPGGQIVSPSCHEYSARALTSVQDFGCGPVTPTSPSGGVIVHDGPSCGCLYSRALPVVASVDWRGTAGAVLYVTSTAPLDLGCGTLPAASGGSTLVTRLDPSGQCVFGASVAVPNLTATLDPTGQVVLSGLVDAAPVDLGGGPLAPLGGQDFVIAELDASGHHVWSRRIGAPGVTFESPKVTVSAAGNVYLQTRFGGAVDLGGGAVTAAAADTVVASYTAAGAHRWSRDFPIAGQYVAGVDGCGSLVVASNDYSDFDAGHGKLPSPWPWYVAVVRFAP